MSIEDEDEGEEEAAPSKLPSVTDTKVTPGNYSVGNMKLDAATINVYKDANAILVLFPLH